MSSISGIHQGSTSGVEPRHDSQQADEMAFSCPNGHRLSGPRSLQGRAGECPKCGVRFRVPIPTQPNSSSVEPDEDDDISLEGIEEIDVSRPKRTPEALPRRNEFSISGQASTCPIVRLFAALWQERAHGGLLELHLDGGVTIAPDWWSERTASEDFGVFAKSIDGAYEIHAIAWNHVRRISVRGLSELPGEMFDV